MLLGTDTTAPYAYTLDGPAGRAATRVQAKAYDNAKRHRGVPEKSFTVTAATGPALVATPSAVSRPARATPPPST